MDAEWKNKHKNLLQLSSVNTEKTGEKLSKILQQEVCKQIRNPLYHEEYKEVFSLTELKSYVP